MNGNWHPWAQGVNGNQAGDYVRAWQHVHDLVASMGATNVHWVWSLSYLSAQPDVMGFVWFHFQKEADWRINSSASSASAFSSALLARRG